MILDPQSTAPLLIHAASLGLGLIFGSFTNVLVARLPEHKNIAYPPSHCPHCQAPIRARDNIPVLSYLLLKGRCRGCKAAISPRYPIIELLGGILFLAAEMRYGISPALFIRDWPFLTMLLAITFIDLEHRIIPDELSLGGLVLGLATSWLSNEITWQHSFYGAALGFGIFYGMAWFYSVVAKRQGLGGGDIKLLAMMGSFLGPAGVLVTIVVSSILGSIIGIGWGLASRNKNLMGFAIPYGPFLVIGGLFYYFFNEFIWLRFMIPT